MLLPLKFKLDRKTLETMFMSFVAFTMYYGIELWGGAHDSALLKLEQIFVDGMRLISGATARSNIAELFEEIAFPTFSYRRDFALCCMMFKIKNHLVPNYLTEIVPKENRENIQYNLRNSHDITKPMTRTEVLQRSFLPRAIDLWTKT